MRDPNAPSDDLTRRQPDPEVAATAGYQLRVADALGTRTLTLPRTGVLVVGRGDDVDLRLDDPSISRRHARLFVAETLQIEDLGSANGTRVRGAALSPHQREELHPGDGLEFGAVLCALLGPAPGRRPRLLREHHYFEARVEDECARVAETRGPFALIHLRVGGDVDAAFESELLEAVRASDLVAVYGPGEYEVFVPGAAPEEAEGMGLLLGARLGRGGRTVRTSVAASPRDGRSPQRLLARARGALLPVPAHASGAPGAVVADAAMRRLHELVPRVAAGSVNVLLLGETGVGKEVIAELLHRHSPRAAHPLVRLNCAAFSESLVESELFGHERGAFTGAVSARAGLLEGAAGGTVFLDEVGELPPGIQAKLLRVIEERMVRRVGAQRAVPIDVRLVAATNRDLEAEVAAGRFRADLFYRLNGFALEIPALRERVSEVAPLAQYFADLARRQAGLAGPAEIDPEALDALEGYRWPGNVRELRNVIERAALLAGDAPLTLEHFPLEKIGLSPRPRSHAPPSAPPSVPPGPDAGDDEERARIVAVLEECVGNQTRAAERLGLTRRQLISRLDRYKLPRPRK